MQKFIFKMPSEIHFVPSTIRELPAVLQSWDAGRVLVVLDWTLREQGFVNEMLGGLEKAGLSFSSTPVPGSW